MNAPHTEHVIDGIVIEVYDLPDGGIGTQIPDMKVMFEASFDGDLERVERSNLRMVSPPDPELRPIPPTQEIFVLMRRAAQEHLAATGRLEGWRKD